MRSLAGAAAIGFAGGPIAAVGAVGTDSVVGIASADIGYLSIATVNTAAGLAVHCSFDVVAAESPVVVAGLDSPADAETVLLGVEPGAPSPWPCLLRRAYPT